MKHLESVHQASVIEWAKWAIKANPSRYPHGVLFGTRSNQAY